MGMIPRIPAQERVAWPSLLTDALPWIGAWRGDPVAVLAKGDPFWFGIGVTLRTTRGARWIARSPGRPGERFARNGAITKHEVRVVVLAHLAPG